MYFLTATSRLTSHSIERENKHHSILLLKNIVCNNNTLTIFSTNYVCGSSLVRVFLMRALRSFHKKLLTFFLFAYFAVLFVSFTSLNMRESPGTILIRSLPYSGRVDKEIYSPLSPSEESHDLATDLTPLKLHKSPDRRRDATSDLFRVKIFKKTATKNGMSYHHNQPQQQQQQQQYLYQQQQDLLEGKAQEQNENKINREINQAQQILATQASYQYVMGKDQPRSRQGGHPLQDTAEANELLFELEKVFPGLKNFQPDPLIEPYEEPYQDNAYVHGDFIAVGRESYVYSAYLDDRQRDDGGVFVRVIALLSQKSATASIYSHNEGEDVSAASRCDAYEMCENHSKNYGGYIFSCPVRPPFPKKRHSSSSLSSSLLFSSRFTPSKDLFSESVNISSILISFGKFAPQIRIPVWTIRPNSSKVPFLDSYHSQDSPSQNWYQDLKTSNDSQGVRTGILMPPSERLDFNQNLPRQKGPPHHLSFAVCVSPLFGDISPTKLIEFIELSQLLGADHFYMYNFSIPMEVSQVLDYYRKIGLVSVLPFAFPVGVRNTDVWYHGQLLANNDCLYRSMPHYDLVAFNDLDEFIVPRGGEGDIARSWREAFSSLLIDDKCGFSFQSAFFDNVVTFPLPEESDRGRRVQLQDLITTSRIARTKRFSKVRTKVMLCPWRVFEVGIHHISKQNREEWLPLSVDPSLAIIHHYRSCVANLGMRCDTWVEDHTIPNRYGDKLVSRVEQVMRDVVRGYGSS